MTETQADLLIENLVPSPIPMPASVHQYRQNMKLLENATREIERLTPYQLIALNAALCGAVVNDEDLTDFIEDTPITAIPKHCLERIEEYLGSEEGEPYLLLLHTSKLIITNFNFLGLLATAKDFISQAQKDDSYQAFMEAHHSYDFTLTDAQTACDEWSEKFHEWLTSPR